MLPGGGGLCIDHMVNITILTSQTSLRTQQTKYTSYISKTCFCTLCQRTCLLWRPWAHFTCQICLYSHSWWDHSSIQQRREPTVAGSRAQRNSGLWPHTASAVFRTLRGHNGRLGSYFQSLRTQHGGVYSYTRSVLLYADIMVSGEPLVCLRTFKIMILVLIFRRPLQGYQPEALLFSNTQYNICRNICERSRLLNPGKRTRHIMHFFFVFTNYELTTHPISSLKWLAQFFVRWRWKVFMSQFEFR